MLRLAARILRSSCTAEVQRSSATLPHPILSQLRFFSDPDAPKQKSSKVKKKAKKAAKVDTARSKDLDLILAALDAPIRKEPPVSEEEKARRHEIGRNYVIGRFRQHNELYHDLNCKIQMKKHAVNMLPKNSKLKEEAMEIDYEGPPLWRNLPVWTAPIPGFDPSQFVEKEE